MSEQVFLQKFAQMPENLRQEVVDFTEYLIMKYKVAEKNPKKVATFGSAKGKYPCHQILMRQWILEDNYF